ncbi:hypothetical protein CHS0354_012279 [Potamilus streckersoni]|uniref:ZZ-type zinc finger-containing protein 3 n=1 Tax=Potamilus streckersoni TaxID=2493646 RepID=A0AAE0SXY2_9BIVA|nr:hypothetical protein CHS0354_012279 [Potamilus streckersoni]
MDETPSTSKDQTLGDEEEMKTETSPDVTDDDLHDEEIDTYYFESDHLALQGNLDYKIMLRTIAMLEAQRIQAIKDLDRLYQCQEEALKDPIAFIDKLQHGIDMKLPQPQKIASLPIINWEKYTSTMDLSALGFHKHMTRLKKQLVEGTDERETETESTLISATATTNDSTGGVLLVRGRVKTETKSSTFNQLWTAEEQKRLEELLIQYPSEDVESRRWQKIATALGNRTPQQVASRVQKYFIKLAKAGLPIPGRMPNLSQYTKRSGHRHHRFHKFYFQPSTFLQSYEPPVYMSDDEDTNSYGESSMEQDSLFDNMEDVSDEEDVPLELRDSEEYLELIRLKQLKREKQLSDGQEQHIGFKCDICECEPIVGTRWHCADCPTEVAVDFCDNCVDSPYETETHNSSHRLQPVRRPNNSTYIDRDYTGFVPGDYNYLDPNYMPAS